MQYTHTLSYDGFYKIAASDFERWLVSRLHVEQQWRGERGMTLDSEQQRKLLQDLMDSVNFPGRAWKEVHDLRMAVEKAAIPNATYDGPWPIP